MPSNCVDMNKNRDEPIVLILFRLGNKKNLFRIEELIKKAHTAEAPPKREKNKRNSCSAGDVSFRLIKPLEYIYF
jgi:hypothetical protein